MADDFGMSVTAIFPTKDGGTVQFEISSHLAGPVTVQMPYYLGTDPNAGVKEAAGYLRDLGQRISQAAAELAK